MKMPRTFALTLILAASLLASGCAALVLGGAVAAGTYVYVDGWSTQSYNASLDRSYNAALKACQNLKMTVEKKEKNISEAKIKAKDGDREVWIDLDSASEKVTKIKVRVGLMGDEVASKKIHDAIAKQL